MIKKKRDPGCNLYDMKVNVKEVTFGTVNVPCDEISWIQVVIEDLLKYVKCQERGFRGLFFNIEIIK